MSLPHGTHLVKDQVIGLTQADLDFLNAHHVEGYEDRFFDDVPAKKVEAPKPEAPKA
jgi:ABC-type Zn uptake system ZnuABC Zn-binding protein ZnuA